jgi:hypothetical protein
MCHESDVRTRQEIIEYKILKNEMIARILLQNCLLFMATGLFSAFVLAIILLSAHVWLLCMTYSVVSAAISVQWCHHGVRIAQLKKYIMIVERPNREQITWEQWLPENRPKTILGSKWLVATKGVLIGLQLYVILLSIYIAKEIDLALSLVSVLLLVITSTVIITNEKEKVEKIVDSG